MFFQRCCDKIRPSDFFLQRALTKNCGVGFLPSLAKGVGTIKNGMTPPTPRGQFVQPRDREILCWGLGWGQFKIAHAKAYES